MYIVFLFGMLKLYMVANCLHTFFSFKISQVSRVIKIYMLIGDALMCLSHCELLPRIVWN